MICSRILSSYFLLMASLIAYGQENIEQLPRMPQLAIAEEKEKFFLALGGISAREGDIIASETRYGSIAGLCQKVSDNIWSRTKLEFVDPTFASKKYSQEISNEISTIVKDARYITAKTGPCYGNLSDFDLSNCDWKIGTKNFMLYKLNYNSIVHNIFYEESFIGVPAYPNEQQVRSEINKQIHAVWEQTGSYTELTPDTVVPIWSENTVIELGKSDLTGFSGIIKFEEEYIIIEYMKIKGDNDFSITLYPITGRFAHIGRCTMIGRLK